MLEDTKKMGWGEEKIFEMSLKIGDELGAALERLAKLQGGKGR